VDVSYFKMIWHTKTVAF